MSEVETAPKEENEDDTTLDLTTKKKKKPKAPAADKEEADAGADKDAADEKEEEEDDDALEDLSTLKSKKKKKKKAATETAAPVADGHVPWEGTERDYAYTELLDRIFSLLRERNPNLAERKRYVLPPPQLVRVGTRKTMWSNFQQICLTMHRNEEHVMAFLLAELGTEGSIDGNHRLVIKGRFVPKQIESLLKKYIVEYVTCHMCRNPETTLTRDPVTRLYFLQCESCNSRRSVVPIKAGFHFTTKADRRKVKAG